MISRETDYREQITAIFNAHQDGLVRFAQRRVRCAQTAADIVQHTFEQILRRKQETAFHVRYLRSYFYRAVSNACKNHFESRDIARGYEPLLEHADRQRLIEGFPSPEESVSELQFLELLQAEVNALPPKSRMAFTLVEIQQYSVREAAETMGVTEMAVYQLVKRSYAMLAQRMLPSLVGENNT